MGNFNLELKLRIDWSDLDMYRHVNNLSFIRFMQSGRVNLWEASGLHKMYEEEQKGAMLVSTNCDFKQSLHYPGSVLVKTRVFTIGNTSFQLEHHLENEKGQLCAIGKDVVVCFDFKANKTFKIEKELRNVLERY